MAYTHTEAKSNRTFTETKWTRRPAARLLTEVLLAAVAVAGCNTKIDAKTKHTASPAAHSSASGKPLPLTSSTETALPVAASSKPAKSPSSSPSTYPAIPLSSFSPNGMCDILPMPEVAKLFPQAAEPIGCSYIDRSKSDPDHVLETTYDTPYGAPDHSYWKVTVLRGQMSAGEIATWKAMSQHSVDAGSGYDGIEFEYNEPQSSILDAFVFAKKASAGGTDFVKVEYDSNIAPFPSMDTARQQLEHYVEKIAPLAFSVTIDGSAS